MTLNLKSLKQQTVIVGDVENVRYVLEKQRVSPFKNSLAVSRCTL